MNGQDLVGKWLEGTRKRHRHRA